MEIITRLRTMQCTAVVGERRIGKSSLIYHLMQTGAQRLNIDPRAATDEELTIRLDCKRTGKGYLIADRIIRVDGEDARMLIDHG